MSDPKPNVQLAILQFLREHNASTASAVSAIYPSITRSCQDLGNVSRERRLNWARVHLCKLRKERLVASRPAKRPAELRSRGIYKLWELTPEGHAHIASAT